jgi:HD superfamily phosphohydrolase
MLIKDKIYGNFETSSPVIIELINAGLFQRLKGINQTGIPNDYYHLKGCSRYDHSVGVFILLNHLGASEEEQVAGLLHDVSHTAFSHVIDWLVNDSSNKEDFQDKRHLSVLQKEEISNILKKYGYSPEIIADYHRFGILEREIPDLCADRIDYSLRESPLTVARESLPNLVVSNNEIVFSNESAALVFADNLLKRQAEHWAGYEAITRYALLSNLLRQAIKNNDIKFDDLLETDNFVIDKIIGTGKKEYLEVLKFLKNKSLDFLPRAIKPIVKKFRYVDPKVLVSGKMTRLSEISTNFKNKLAEAKSLNLQGVRPGMIS